MSDSVKKNCILFDWFSMTSTNDTLFSWISRLRLDKCQFTERVGGPAGKYGFKKTYSFMHINIYTNHFNDDSLTMLDMSGQGCREFETYGSGDFVYLFRLCCTHDSYNVTRLDVAHDDHEGLLNIDTVWRETMALNYVSKARKNIKTSEYNGDFEEKSIMFGKKSSEVYVRIYDKAAERGYDSDVHWVRTEIVLKHDRAAEFLRMYLGGMPIGKLFYGVLNNYIRFIVPDPTESNKSRLKVRKWWLKFIGSVERISVYVKKDVEYNLHKLKRYVFHQCGNSIETLIRCIGGGDFFTELLERDTRLTERQKVLIKQCNAVA